jgi:cytochrome c oxidase subunit 2
MSTPNIEVDSFWLPKASSTIAASVDSAYYLVYWVSIFFFALIVGLMIFSAIRFRRRRADQVGRRVNQSLMLELAWSILPAISLMVLFGVGVTGFVNSQVAPGNALQVQVTAQMYSWNFTYPNGTTSPELVVPQGSPVKLIMSSTDTIHSLWIPEFRIKQDVVPGMYSTIWFEATDVTKTALLCTEYCGVGHSTMSTTVNVMDPVKFKSWLDNGGSEENLPPAEAGKKIFAERGCVGCHSLDGNRLVGPSMKGLWGHDAELADGSMIKVDENYLRESLLTPGAKIVKGYPNVMPTFQGLLKDKDIDAVIAFIKTVE